MFSRILAGAMMVAICLSSCVSLARASADDKLETELAYARARATIIVNKVVQAAQAECATPECRAAEQRASEIIAVVLGRKRAVPLPPAVPKVSPVVSPDGRTLTDQDGKRWVRNAAGFFVEQTDTRPGCQLINGQMVCPTRQYP